MMNSADSVESIRVDKWLWAVRVCKTRQIATDLCQREKVLVDGQRVKPSRDVRPGQVVTVKKDGIEYQYRVIKRVGKRVGAPEAAGCREDITPKEALEKLKMIRSSWTPRRPKGAGRPTKKERRDLRKALGK